MTTHVVATTDELRAGDRVVVEIDGREIAVFNNDGDYRAYLNWCLHQGGPCCEGPLTGTYTASYDRDTRQVDLRWHREDEILNCPWHGWEYDVTTGECLSRQHLKLPSYPVHVENGNIIVTV